jgi:drug/metabolite transporter (DMT)-like permease
MHHLPAMVKTAYPFFFMGTLYLMILLGTGIMKKWDTNPTQAWESFGYLILLGVFGSAISMIIFNILIKHTSALVASTNTFIIPVVAVLWGVYDHETLTWNMFVGLGLSLAGIYLIMRKDNHLPATEEDVTDLKEF